MDSGSLRVDFGVREGGFLPFSGPPFSGPRRSFGEIPGPQGSPRAVWGDSGGPRGPKKNCKKIIKIRFKFKKVLENLVDPCGIRIIY